VSVGCDNRFLITYEIVSASKVAERAGAVRVVEAVTMVVMQVGAFVTETGVILSMEMTVFTVKQASMAKADSTTV